MVVVILKKFNDVDVYMVLYRFIEFVYDLDVYFIYVIWIGIIIWKCYVMF